MIFVGLLFGCIGTDINSGVARYTFGWFRARARASISSPLAVGVFGLTEILPNLETHRERARSAIDQDRRACWMTKRGLSRCVGGRAARHDHRLVARRDPRRRHARSSTFASYTVEKKFAARSLALRQGRHRGRRRPGIGQQCRRADLVHPAC